MLSTLDVLAEEAPVSIAYAGIAHATFMATPEHLDDLAVGFSITEGIALCAAHVRTIDVIPEGDGYAVDITLSPARHRAFLAKHRTRARRGRTLHGVYGARNLDDARSGAAPVAMPPCLPPDALRRAIAAVRERASADRDIAIAAFADQTGAIVAQRGDLDRHNAFDKLVGCVSQRNIDVTDGFCLVTRHCTYEIVQKAEAARFPTIIALRPPTSLAVRAARDAGVMLMSVCAET